MSSPMDWYSSLPPVTRAFGTGVVVATVGAKFGLVSPYALKLSWPAVKQKLQVCTPRLVRRAARARRRVAL